MRNNLELVVSGTGALDSTANSSSLFDLELWVLQSRYDNYQIRIDLINKGAELSSDSPFDASGKFEITTSASIVLTKPPYSWIDVSRPHMWVALRKLLDADALCLREQPIRRLPPYGQVLQRVISELESDRPLRLN